MQVVNNASHPIKGGSSLHLTKLRRTSRLCSGVVISIALLALTGWMLDLAWMKSALPGLPTMKINTAISLLLGGLGLALLNHSGNKYKKEAQLFFILIVLDGGINLVQYLFNVDLGIDQLLIQDNTRDATFPGRMAIITAISFTMVGVSGVMLTRPRPSFYVAHALLVLVFTIAFTAILGYCYGIRSFYFGIGEYAAMALHTALAFLFLTVGLLLKYSDKGIVELFFSPYLRKYLIHEYILYLLGLPALFLGILLYLYRREDLALESVFLIFTVSFTVFTGTIYWLKLLFISEQEAHNATLQTSKDALLATNEQLSVINEELQISNEQLYLTVTKLNEANQTIQRLSQEALQMSESKYRELAESFTDMFFALNENLECTYWNKACEIFSGMKAAEVLGKSIIETVPPLSNSEVKSIAREVLQTHKTTSFTVESHAYLPSTDAFLEISVYPSQKGLSVFVKDITERKKGEIQLNRTVHELQNYKDALDKSILVSITDSEGSILLANDMFCYLTKYAREELLGQDHCIINSAYHPKSFFTKMWQTIASGRYWRDEIKNKAKDGTYFWVDMVITPILNEQEEIIQYLAICYDITDRKQTEEKIAESERLHRLIAGNFPGYILMINKDRTVSFLEGKSLLTNGWMKPDMIGKSIFTLMEPEVEKQIDNYIELALEGEETNFEFLVKERYWSFNILPLFYSEQGNVENLLCVVLDVTERKKMLDQRIELENLKLEQEIERHKIRAASLIAGMEKERIRIAQELHDGIGQILNVVKLKTDTVKANYPQVEQQMKELSQMISGTIAEVRGLIKDLSPYILTHLSLESAIRNLVQTYEQSSSIPIHFQLWINLKNKRLDRNLELSIYRIIQEGVNNIIKHAKASNVTIQLTELDKELLLMIEDDGTGFDYQEKVPAKAGYGLQNIAERCLIMNASLEIDTQPGHGCTINIHIPL